MAPEPKRPLRCAIYTRKSSEEGLEQEFNSLHAQREACEAFIASQRHEGWQLVRKHYDDGGFSGGSIERPGIQTLLHDVQARQVDVVVVYKVDRLTRSLSDFAKMVEVFDANGASFVSVTQQFNTTSSMGRLTLNILLSFAQFEREVTGERIRDKFAASRKKGMWMGGTIPLGYDLKDRKLIVNKKEAEQVRRIFETYVRVGCVRKLQNELEASGVTTKRWISSAGIARGGRSPSRGSLYNLLRNRLYLGDAVHKGKAHSGEHEAIVPFKLWEEVQNTLERNRSPKMRRAKVAEPSLLSGLVFDDEGNSFSPSHTSRQNRRYRYYVNQAVLQNKKMKPGQVARVPAHDLEETVKNAVINFLRDKKSVFTFFKGGTQESARAIEESAKAVAERITNQGGKGAEDAVLSILEKIQISQRRLEIAIDRAELAKLLKCDTGPRAGAIKIATQVSPGSYKSRFKIIQPLNVNIDGGVQVSALKSIARAHGWWNQLLTKPDETLESIAKRSGVCQRYVSQTLKLAFLNPLYTDSIASGPTLSTLPVREMICDMPAAWDMQHSRWPMKGVA